MIYVNEIAVILDALCKVKHQNYENYVNRVKILNKMKYF